MAYKAKQKETKEQPKLRSMVKDLLLYVFEVNQSKNGDWLLIRAKMSSKPVEGEKYGNGINVNLMAKIEDALIDDELDDSCWVRVDGAISAEDWAYKDKHGTQLVVRADKISVSNQ